MTKIVRALRAEDGTTVQWHDGDSGSERVILNADLNADNGGWEWTGEAGREALVWWAVHILAALGERYVPELAAAARAELENGP